jgi:Type I restriction enzyme R protein N terminus (HSDR_N)
MIENKGFPSSLLSVEQQLKNLPNLSVSDRQHVPNRRADIICYAKSAGGLHPLLIVECKSIKLTPSMMNQVVGYNHFVRSRYIMIANQEEIRTGWFDKGKNDYVFIDFLPSYTELFKGVTDKYDRERQDQV